MGVRLILVRHGQTDWNKQDKLQGRTNISLNENGINQIRRTAVEIKKSGEKPTLIISSPLRRAFQSAVIISFQFRIPITLNDNLAERDFGKLEGLTWKRINQLYGPDFKKIDRKQQYDYSYYGGESAEQVGKRILDFIDYVIQEHEGETIIVVTHAGILRYLSFIFDKMGMNFRHDLKAGGYCIIEL